LLVLRHHRVHLEQTRQQLLSDQSALQVEVRKLGSEDHYLQNLIRRELGFARPDELIYRFRSDAPPR